ncbi:putative BURP domain-containing protein [Helianthus annuus]|nr:putative BURP domain-containing protein [Helianthus annuus]
MSYSISYYINSSSTHSSLFIKHHRILTLRFSFGFGFGFGFSPMKFTILHVFTLFSVTLVGSHATTGETYWNSVLPNSPMPKAVKDLLYTTERDDETITRVGKQVQAPNVGVGRGGIGVHYGNRRNPGSVGVQPGKNPFVYNYAASKDQLKDDPNVALFFLEKDLHQGTEMNLHFTKNDQKSMFLPRKVVDSIPFSSKDLPQIYNRFSVKPDSMEGQDMKQTLNECENKGIEGEEKYCATSLESMVDFVTTKFGKKVKAISTEVNAKESAPLQKYKVELAKKRGGDKVVVCHKQIYPYAVFYCHETVATRVYAVSVVGVDGMKVNVVAVCHIDTAKWNPKHLAFQVLKVKPGSVPVCHFLPEDHVVWVQY